MKLKTLLVLALAVSLFVSVWLFTARRGSFEIQTHPAHYDVRILRDEWGVPHIFGKTDAEVAYGLAYAHAEDDFATMQGVLLASRGKLASVFGKDAAPNDYMVQLLRIGEVVETGYPKLSADTRALCEAYAAGMNRYAALHPEQAHAELYPVRGQDLVAGFVHKVPLFFGIDKALKKILEPTLPPTSANNSPKGVHIKHSEHALKNSPLEGGQGGVAHSTNESNNHPRSQEHPPTLFKEGITGIFAMNKDAHDIPSSRGVPLHSQNDFDNEVTSSNSPQKYFDFSRQLKGSNTFSIGPRRTADKSTWLAINSHQPWDGPVAWYEVHLHSEQGWNMVGGLFPGAPIVLHGHNPQLGWAHTVNLPDLLDVYQLEINPQNALQYRFDDAWRELEVREAPIAVKLFGPIKWTFKREVLWSVHGPVMRGPNGTFALRFAGFGEVRHIEQWYRMNKARNLDEWLSAMRMNALPMFNTGYADSAGNIFYLYNGRIPQRPSGYDWQHEVPGNTSATLWQEYLPFEQLPRVLNPASGFVQNCNSTPFQTTTGSDNPSADDLAVNLGIETHMTNRGLRALELFSADSSITAEEFLDYKYDLAYSKQSKLALLIRQVLAEAPPRDSLMLAAWEILRAWDLRTNPDNVHAALPLLAFRTFVDDYGKAIPTAALSDSLQRATRVLMQHHGALAVEWQKVNRMRRGALDLGLGGGPDILHAVYGKPDGKGHLLGHTGDSYVLLVNWDHAGKVRSQSIHVYGSATANTTSKHYADQAPDFAQRKLKPVWIEEEEIRAHLEKEYRPGEELRE